MPDTCIDCEHLREATGYYFCCITGEHLAYEPGVDEAAWSDECPLDAEEGDDQ
jgi:hypothetical protein